jgi:isopropylmalate/homocitrate/citramalate synthase
MKISELIYDWNQNYPAGLRPPGAVLLNDETLRDGLQSPSVRDPSIEEKIHILHLMEALGIQSLDLGLPGAGPRAVEHVAALAREIVQNKLKIRANCAARTLENDIRPIAEIVQRTGLNIAAATFLGSSPIRRYTEGWTDDFLLKTTETAVKFAVSFGLDVMYVTEDTSRCDPETVKRLYSAAINFGARTIVVCDTSGHATPMGAFALVKFVVQEVVKP